MALVLGVIITSSAIVADAQADRTFVSAQHGNDANNSKDCALAAPCKTFGAALGVTNAGGEVVALDSGSYAPFAINHSVSVTAPQGVHAEVTVPSGDGISVSAGSNDIVKLRGLTVSSQGTSGNGIDFHTGGALHVENCVITGFNGNMASGLIHNPTNYPGNGSPQLFVKDTIARNNYNGIELDAEANGRMFASIDNVTLTDNAFGLFLLGDNAVMPIRAAIIRSSISGNSRVGIQVEAVAGLALLDIESCLITNNVSGLVVELGPASWVTAVAAASISNCLISHNTTYGVYGNSILSRGNNTIIGNGSDPGNLTPLAGQ